MSYKNAKTTTAIAITLMLSARIDGPNQEITSVDDVKIRRQA